MLRLDIFPFPGKIFRDEAAVAMMRLVLAAKQTPFLQDFGWNGFFDFALRNQI